MTTFFQKRQQQKAGNLRNRETTAVPKDASATPTAKIQTISIVPIKELRTRRFVVVVV